MAAAVKRTEEFFLKIFKVTILVVMTVAFLAIIGLAIAAVYEFTQTPKEPPPAQKAPDKEVGLENLKNFLIEEEKNKNKKNTGPKQQPGDAPALRYLEDATTLFRCSDDFGKNVGAEIEAADNQKQAQMLEALRANVEEVARGDLRGDAWVKNAVTFTCRVLADPSVVALRKDSKIGSVFYPTLQFHIRAWDNIQAQKVAFENKEQQRVNTARAAEAIRIGLAKAKGVTYLISAGGAFGLFMALALYLLAAKIETNIREISQSVRNNGRISPNA